jgi:hypothetical protein
MARLSLTMTMLVLGGMATARAEKALDRHDPTFRKYAKRYFGPASTGASSRLREWRKAT